MTPLCKTCTHATAVSLNVTWKPFTGEVKTNPKWWCELNRKSLQKTECELYIKEPHDNIINP